MLDSDPSTNRAPGPRIDREEDLEGNLHDDLEGNLHDDLDEDPDDLDEDPDDLAVEDLLDPTRVLSELEELPPSMIELDKVPRRLWEQTLAPLHRPQRCWIAEQVSDKRLQRIAMSLAFKLDMDECKRRDARDEARHEARRSGFPLPAPGPGHAAARPTVQVNIRLRADDHARLGQAAAAVGLKPTTLARALVLNGAARMLEEHGTAR